jgi:hypothetical protein
VLAAAAENFECHCQSLSAVSYSFERLAFLLATCPLLLGMVLMVVLFPSMMVVVLN